MLVDACSVVRMGFRMLLEGSPDIRVVVCLAAFGLFGAVARADALLRPGTYEIVVETVMPHLEENLRYATIREVRCLRSGEFASLFPIMTHGSMAGCVLRDAGDRDESVHYRLVCQQPDVASGSARLRPRPGGIDGILQVKMGGKNMTFEQRVRAAWQGDCP
jgi:hypothetical protein